MHYLENTLTLYRSYAQQNQKLANKQTNILPLIGTHNLTYSYNMKFFNNLKTIQTTK